MFFFLYQSPIFVSECEVSLKSDFIFAYIWLVPLCLQKKMVQKNLENKEKGMFHFK